MLNRVKIIKLAAMAVLGSFCAAACAADKACLLEGTVVFLGKTTHTKDCLENSGAPVDTFKSACQKLSQMSEDIAKQTGSPRPKTTYLSSCPPKASASCVGFFGQPMTTYYYNRDAKDVAEIKESCLFHKGKWQQ